MAEGGALQKLLFTALPSRATGDTRLTGLHWRVLACIAAHDRLSDHRAGGQRGQGCWASHATIAKEACCDYTSLSKAIAALASYGYITGSPHPINRRLRVYRVVYDQGDDGDAGDSWRNGQVSRAAHVAHGAPHGSTVGEAANDPARIVGRANGQAVQREEQSDANIFCETENKSGGNRQHNTAGAASQSDGRAMVNVGSILAQFERHWRDVRGRGNDIHRGDVEAWAAKLYDYSLNDGLAEPLRQQAARLGDELAQYIGDRFGRAGSDA